MQLRTYRVLLGSILGLVPLLPAHAQMQVGCAREANTCAATPEVGSATDPSPAGGTESSTVALTRTAPVVTSPYVHPGYRDVTQGSSAYSITPPAYVSRDVPRSVTMFYSSGQAKPTGVVSVAATDNSSEPALRMSIRVKAPNGYWATGEMFFDIAPGTNRLSAQFDASGYNTGAYDFQAVVRSYWSDGQALEAAPVTVRVLLVNEANSIYGPGWTLPGVARLYNQNEGVMITNGDGTAVFFTRSSSGALTAPEGDFSTVTWDNTYFRRWFPDGSVHRFLASGLMIDATDRFGNTTAFGYDANSLLRTITDPAGKVTQLGYASLPEPRLNGITDPAGRLTYIYHGSNHDPYIIDYPGGVEERLGWSADHRLASRAVQVGGGWATRDYAYDFTGSLASVTQPAVTIAGGTQARPQTKLSSWTRALVADSASGDWISSSSSRRVPADLRTTVTDANGNVTKLALDRFGQPTRVEDAQNRATVILRGTTGLPDRTTDYTGHTTRYEWSGMDLVKAVDETRQDSTMYTYGNTSCAHLATRVDATDQSTYVEYGSACELRKVRTGSTTAYPTAYAYDAANHYRLLSVVDSATGTGTRYYFGGNTWANTDSVTSTSSTLAPQTVRLSYDAYGRTSSTRDPIGRITQMGYDLLNRPTTVTDPALQVTRVGYNGIFADTLVDAAGKVYVTGHNALGWVTATSDASGTRTYGYNAAGQVASRTNRRGQTVSTTYDSQGRVQTVTTPDAGTTTWSYPTSTSDHWVAVSNPESTDTIHFNSNNLNNISDEINTRGATRVVQVYYPTKATQQDTAYKLLVEGTANWSRRIRYKYAPIGGYMTGMYDMSGAYTAFFRDTAQRVTTIQYPGAFVLQTVAYNPRGLLAAATLSAGLNDVLLSPGYGYDALNRNNLQTWQRADSQFTRSIAYDSVGRVKAVTDTRAYNNCVETATTHSCTPVNGTVASSSFAYDAVGNRTDSGAGLQANSNRLSQFGGFSFEYDADGNMTRKYNTTTGFDQYFTWNSLGQLTGVGQTGVGWVTYGYDGMGQRVRRVDQNTGATTRYFYKQGDLVAETDYAGNLIRGYTYYPDAIDAPHSVYDAATNKQYYYAMERPGHVTGLFEANGNVVNKYKYTAYGTIAPGYPTEGIPQPLRYMAREIDATTGLYYVRNRWYDQSLGRFVSEDPIGLAGGINQYAYAGNDPVNSTDPSGLRPCNNGPAVMQSGGTCLLDPIALATHWVSVGLSGKMLDGDVPGGPAPFNLDQLAALEEAKQDDQPSLARCIRRRWWSKVKETNAAIPGLAKTVGVNGAIMAYRFSAGVSPLTAGFRFVTGSAATFTHTAFAAEAGVSLTETAIPALTTEFTGVGAVLGGLGEGTVIGLAVVGAFEFGVALGSVARGADDCINGGYMESAEGGR